MIDRLKIAMKHGEVKKQVEESRTALDKELKQVQAILDAEAQKKKEMVKP